MNPANLQQITRKTDKYFVDLLLKSFP